jgi:hypothetical protein
MRKFIDKNNSMLNGEDYSLARAIMVRVLGEDNVAELEEMGQTNIESIMEEFLEQARESIISSIDDMGLYICKDCGAVVSLANEEGITLDELHSLKDGGGVCAKCYGENYVYCSNENCHHEYVEKYEDMVQIEGLKHKDGWYCKGCAESLISIKKGLEEFKELREFVKNTKLSFKELLEYFKGWNLDEELFDFNYKSLTATLINRDNKIELSENIEIWDDPHTAFIGTIDAYDYIEEE